MWSPVNHPVNPMLGQDAVCQMRSVESSADWSKSLSWWTSRSSAGNGDALHDIGMFSSPHDFRIAVDVRNMFASKSPPVVPDNPHSYIYIVHFLMTYGMIYLKQHGDSPGRKLWNDLRGGIATQVPKDYHWHCLHGTSGAPTSHCGGSWCCHWICLKYAKIRRMPSKSALCDLWG